MDRRPSHDVSPRRLRPRRTTRPLSSSIQTPPASAKYKAKTQTRSSFDISCTGFISSELEEMAKKLENKYSAFDVMLLDNENIEPMFERGRFYELYSARRNQRLMKKKLESKYDDDIDAQDSEFSVEASKNKNLKKGQDSNLRKLMPVNFGTATPRSSLRSSSVNFGVATPRSSLRSSKEVKQMFGTLDSARKPTATSSRRTTSNRLAVRI